MRTVYASASLLAACSAGGAPMDALDAAAGGPVDASSADVSSLFDAAAAEASSEASVPAERRPVVHAALWEPLDAARDPFGDRPADAACEPASFGEELLGGVLAFYVRSERCPYLTVTQASRLDIPGGATLTFEGFIFPLTAPAGATAHLAIRIGETLAWERQIPIPDPGGPWSAAWTAPAALPRGTPVYFHVHNHGSNEYTLLSIDMIPATRGEAR